MDVESTGSLDALELSNGMRKLVREPVEEGGWGRCESSDMEEGGGRDGYVLRGADLRPGLEMWGEMGVD